tara:strand:+ start:641 stop:2539 length:1899 start_codon:yes stop_codon:yes gene_type:complete
MDNPATYVSYGDFGFKGEGFITPYVSRTQTPIYYGVRSGQITQIDLNGQITGSNYDALISAQTKLISGFSKDFQSLSLRDGSALVEGFPISNCIVDNINFSEGQYNQLLDYSITLRAYEASLFSGVSKVLSPVNSFAFSETSEGQRSITHTISAQGINTNASGTIEGNALDNAKDFVLSLTGWSNQIMPEMIRKGDFTKYTTISPSLKSQSESVNRMNGTFSVTEDWVFDENNSEDAARTVTVDIQSGINTDFVTATVNVNVQGDKRKSITEIRNKVPRNNELYKIAKDNFEVMRADASRQLNSQPSSVNVDEDAESKTISVSAVFSDNDIHPYAVIGASNAPEGHPHKKQDYAYFDYSVDLNRDEISSVTQVSINGTILGIGGDLKNRYAAANQFLTGLNKNLYATGTGSNANVSFFGLSGFLYEKAKGEYDSFFTSSDNYGLNQTLNSLTISPNEFNGTISVTASFDDTDKFLGEQKLFDSASYSVSVKPALPAISVKPIVKTNETEQKFFDLGYMKKSQVDLSCSFQGSKNSFFGKEDLVAVAKNDAYNLRRALKEKYVDNEVLGKPNSDASDSSDFVKVESDSFEYDPNNGNVSMSSSYSFNSQKNYFMKKPKKLGPNEDPLTNTGLD